MRALLRAVIPFRIRRAVRQWWGPSADQVSLLHGSVEAVWDELLRLRAAVCEMRCAAPGVWWQGTPAEPAVVLGFRDLCRPGDVAFDCGAHNGGLTVVLSRLVGPRGVVCAFEASPRTVDALARTVALNGCHNVTPYHAAVHARSNEWVAVRFDPYDQADAVVPGPTGPDGVRVPTLALDDHVRRTGLVPDFVKMDVEGSEFDAVTGFADTLARARPHLILETNAGDDRCLQTLRGLGYVAIDTATYEEVRSSADLPAGATVRNLAYVHDSRLDEVGYRLPFERVAVAALRRADFEFLPGGAVRQRRPVELPAGRYVVRVDAEGGGTDRTVVWGVRAGGRVAMSYQADAASLCRSYRDWAVHLPEPAAVELFCELLGPLDPAFRFGGAVVHRLPRFDGRPFFHVV